MKMNKSSSFVHVQPRSTKDIYSIAKTIRKLAKAKGFIRRDTSIDIVGFYEHLAGTISSFKWHVAEIDEFPDSTHEGLTKPNGEILILSSVYEGALTGSGRDVFTMAHELFHWMVHRKEFGLARAGVNVKSYRDPEWQANTGASYILMPRGVVKQYLGDAERLAAICRVSVPAAKVRIRKYRDKGF